MTDNIIVLPYVVLIICLNRPPSGNKVRDTNKILAVTRTIPPRKLVVRSNILRYKPKESESGIRMGLIYKNTTMIIRAPILDWLHALTCSQRSLFFLVRRIVHINTARSSKRIVIWPGVSRSLLK